MKTDSTKKMTRVKVGADESIRVTIGDVGAVISGDLLSVLCVLKQCFPTISDCLASLTTAVIDKSREGEETIESYRTAIRKLECLGNLRESLSVVCRQPYYLAGHAVVDCNTPGVGEADEDTAAEE